MAPFTIVKKAVEKLIRSRVETDYLGSWAGGELEVFIKREYATAENNRGQTKAYVKAVLNDQDTRYKLNTQFAFADLNGAIFDMPTPKTARKANPAPRKRAAIRETKNATVNVYEMYGTRGEYAADILYRGKLLKQFAGMDLAAIFRQVETWCTNQGYAIRLNDETRRKNPAPRKRAISRPSQVTKKAPTKRLVSRRKAAAKKPVKGYFPNPRKAEKLVTLQIEIDRGKGWEFYTNFQHGKSHVRAITEMATDAAKHAAKMNPSWMVRVIKK